MRRSWSGLCAAAVLFFLLRPAAADVVFLRGGGRLEGEIVNPKENPRKTYVVKPAVGGQITLDAAVVEKVEIPPPELAEFEKVRGQYPDTPQGQMQLSDWCRDHNLAAQRKEVLRHVIQLDPDHAAARRLLDYHKTEAGEWMTFEEEQARKGLVNRDGKWITKQEAENRKEFEKRDKIAKEWRGKVHRWRAWMDGNRSDQGMRNLKAIDDPLAIPALVEHLKKDNSAAARLIYIEVLKKLNTPEARAVLAVCAIDDELDDVRLTALESLAKIREDMAKEKQADPQVVAYFVKRLRDKKASNVVINRAGVALGYMKDPASTLDLIQYLVTMHDEVVQAGGGPGAMTSTFDKSGRGGGGSFGMNQKPKIVRHIMQNSGVLDALVKIAKERFSSEANFGYDQRAWKTWYDTHQAKGPAFDARRN